MSDSAWCRAGPRWVGGEVHRPGLSVPSKAAVVGPAPRPGQTAPSCSSHGLRSLTAGVTEDGLPSVLANPILSSRWHHYFVSSDETSLNRSRGFRELGRSRGGAAGGGRRDRHALGGGLSSRACPRWPPRALPSVRFSAMTEGDRRPRWFCPRHPPEVAQVASSACPEPLAGGSRIPSAPSPNPALPGSLPH